MNQDDFNYKALEQLKIIASRLESIERMLGEEKPLSPSECKAIWHGEVEQEPEWTTGAPKENKMVRVSVPGNDERWVGHITKDGGWNIYSLNSAIDTVVPFYRSRKRINQWRELTEEENTLCWERGILGASEEHAELSTLELPIDKHEPEWRPMELQKGNVIFTGGSKYVVRTPRSLEPTEKFICNRPHEDGDFSYLCGSDYCRCCS